MAHFGPLNPAMMDEAANQIAQGQNAAQIIEQLGISRRTLTRWKAREDFRERVGELRAEFLGQAMGKAAEAASEAADALKKLLKSGNEGIVLGAARSLLQLSGSLFDTVQLQAEIRQMTRKLAEIEAADKKQMKDSDKKQDES